MATMRALGSLTVALSVSALLPLAIHSESEADQREKAFQEQIRPILKQYCVACHNAKVKTAGVALDGLTSAESLVADTGTWERVLRKVRTGEMPPTGMPHPVPAVQGAFSTWVGNELDRLAAQHPDPGRVAIHRLNRAEYNNAVRDLFGIDAKVADSFPADDSGYGFDNIADVLSVPPVLMEKYLAAANKVARQALGRVRYDAVLDRFNAPRKQSQASRLNESAPVSSRGGMELEHSFPADAEYLLRVRLRGTPDPNAPETIDVRLDGKLLKRIEAKVGTEEENEEGRRFEIRTAIAAGPHTVLVTFLRDDSKNESPSIEFGPDGKARRSPLGVDWIEVGGPFNVTGPGNTDARKRLLACSSGKQDDACAREILGRVARRAWRRPVTAAELDKLAGFYRMGKGDAGDFEGGVELALRAVLVSPNFLFRVERDPADAKPGGVYQVSDLDLASRLSFFLWSSIPDEELLATAERGQLHDPAVFEKQVRRMLADRRSTALTTNFAGQWLHLRNVAAIKPDPEKFPDFDDDLRQAMQKEAELFFGAVVKEDRSALDFLDAKFDFVNERLAKFYGIPHVEGNRFRRVELTDNQRGGVMTMGAVLAVTSYPTRTSAVIRGKWVLENLLGAPPPPPPPDVPPLKESGLGKTASMRQQLEAHRSNPACASCHSKMDPIGFALEHYDSIGRFRAKDGDFDVDASGKLPSGESFNDAAELKRILRSHPDEFVMCLTEKLMTYALGRGIERTDKPVIRSIARDAAKNDYRMSSIVLGIVNSAPFRMRRAYELSTENQKGKEALRASNH